MKSGCGCSVSCSLPMWISLMRTDLLNHISDMAAPKDVIEVAQLNMQFHQECFENHILVSMNERIAYPREMQGQERSQATLPSSPAVRPLQS
jgi:hypothetical protein